ncbi:MAG: hypothetical protein WBZ31_09655 [Thiobacillus sp.]|jgi:hypothetical protein
MQLSHGHPPDFYVVMKALAAWDCHAVNTILLWMRRSIVELVFATQGHACIFTGKKQGKFLPAAPDLGLCGKD